MTPHAQKLFAAFKVAMEQNLAVTFTYTNKKGERSERHILPVDITVSARTGNVVINALDLTKRDENNKLEWRKFIIDSIDPSKDVVLYEKPPRGYARDRDSDSVRTWLTTYSDEAVFMAVPAAS